MRISNAGIPMLCAAGAIFAPIAAHGEDAWWDSGWNERSKLIFDNSGQSEDLVSFTVLVALNSDRIDFAKVQGSGEDLRFIDSDGTVLDYEIETWDETGECLVWVTVGRIDGGSSTDYIWMYYSNTSAPEGQDAAFTWASGYDLVWHFNETSGSTIYDSTGNDNDGTKVSSNEPAPDASGLLGRTQLFDGFDDGVEVLGLESPSEITIEAWIRPESVPDPSSWASILRYSYDMPFFGLILTHSGDVILDFWNDQDWVEGDVAIPFDAWSYVVATHDGATASLYVNGVLDISAPLMSSFVNTDLNVGVWIFGTEIEPFDGRMDELRVSGVVRSSDWVRAQHLSMTGEFITLWADEAEPVRVLTWESVPPVSSN